MSHLVGVPSAVVDSIWSDCEPLVDRCLKKVKEFRWDTADVLDMIRNASVQLWLCVGDEDKQFHGVVLTEILVTPKAKECSLYMMAGKMPEDWRKCLEQLEDWARAMGCTHMSTMSRPGSAKLIGYEKGLIRTHRGL